MRVRGAGYDKKLSFGGTDGGPTHARHTQTFFIARIYLTGRGYTWETWCDTSSLDFDVAHEFHIERPSKCSNCIGSDMEQRSALLSLRYNEELKKNIKIKGNACERFKRLRNIEFEMLKVER